jgi:valyl-tRNA synthetase
VNYYYPTNDLVTGPDILFFWVARMIVAGYEFRDERPYENVYLTGLVRDKQRRKMSKSLGNSPDALKLIDEYGADGVRVGLLLSSAAGNDLMFDEALCQQGKNFANKIWNAFRLVKGWDVADIAQPEASKIGVEWYTAKFNETLAEIEDHYSKYRISDALMAIYKLVWDDFCSWFLEIVKPAYQQPIDKKTLAQVIQLFEENLKLLHPFMPFLSEEVWQHMSKRTPKEALCIANWPAKVDFDKSLISDFDFAAEVISGVRNIRKEKNIPNKEVLELLELPAESKTAIMNAIIVKLSNVSSITQVDKTVNSALSFRVASNEYFIPIAGAIDVEEEIKKLNEELKYTKGFLQSVQKKLSNERFVNNAPEKVVEMERKKVADAEAKIETLEKSLASLS